MAWLGIICIFFTIAIVTLINDENFKPIGVSIVGLIGGLFFLLIGISSLIMTGEKKASKECIEGECPYKQTIIYEKETECGEPIPTDTIYELR